MAKNIKLTPTQAEFVKAALIRMKEYWNAKGKAVKEHGFECPPGGFKLPYLSDNKLKLTGNYDIDMSLASQLDAHQVLIINDKVKAKKITEQNAASMIFSCTSLAERIVREIDNCEKAREDDKKVGIVCFP